MNTPNSPSTPVEAKPERRFVVCNEAGIPFRNQEYMTFAECKSWIRHDVQECHKCGLNTITAADYIIKGDAIYGRE